MKCEICLLTCNKEDLVECSVCGRLVCPDCIAFDDLCVDCYEEEETSWLDEPFWHFYHLLRKKTPSERVEMNCVAFK